ncbi:MAG TPA: M48 family metalloprotease [Acidimicrobiales bacterium]|nr:M48 family metalloprotease [Acidimicrobiales bacterium]
MSPYLVVLGLVMLALPAALNGLGSRLAPEEWSGAVVVCLRTGRATVVTGLAFAALPGLLRAAGAEGFAHDCHLAMTAGLPAPRATGWLTTAALVALAARLAAARRDDRRARGRLRAEPWLGTHRVEDGLDVVTLPCAERIAYAVPGHPDQIVLSDGLLAVLDDDEAAAVLRHERAHLRHRHHRALALARSLEATFGWLAPARGSAMVLRLAVERWADEEAAGGPGADRPAVRRALVKSVALAPAAATPTFSDVETIAARLDALAAAAPAPSLRDRAAATAPLLGLSALALGALAACIVVSHETLDRLLGHCPF